MSITHNLPQPNSEVPAALAFCATRPSKDDVTGALQTMGFCLTFQMEESIFHPSLLVPSLPAQYHYRDRYNTEVIYLGGCDADLDEAPLPPHASRFWIYCGANLQAYQKALHATAAQWSLNWHTDQSSETFLGRTSAKPRPRK